MNIERMKYGTRIINAVMSGYGLVPYTATVDTWNIYIQCKYDPNALERLLASKKFCVEIDVTGFVIVNRPTMGLRITMTN